MSTEEGGKGGLIAAVVAALGLGGARFLDDAARMGARTADDFARTGSGAAGTFDDAARHAPAGGAVLDDAARQGAYGEATLLDDGARSGRTVHPVAVPDEGRHLEQLGEVTVDLGLELVDVEFESDAPTPRTFVELAESPKVVDLARESGAWTHLVDTGIGAGDAPWILIGRARGESMVVGDEAVPITTLAAECWRLGTTCVFVACETSCARETQRVAFETIPSEGMRVDAYVTQFLTNRFAATPKPAFVAVAGGGPERSLKLFRPQADAP